MTTFRIRDRVTTIDGQTGTVMNVTPTSGAALRTAGRQGVTVKLDNGTSRYFRNIDLVLLPKAAKKGN